MIDTSKELDYDEIKVGDALFEVVRSAKYEGLGERRV